MGELPRVEVMMPELATPWYREPDDDPVSTTIGVELPSTRVRAPHSLLETSRARLRRLAGSTSPLKGSGIPDEIITTGDSFGDERPALRNRPTLPAGPPVGRAPTRTSRARRG